jgi:hypothetical protein
MEEFHISKQPLSKGLTVTITCQGTKIGHKYFRRADQADAWISRKTKSTRRQRRQFTLKEA